jgi:hypothetical protein
MEMSELKAWFDVTVLRCPHCKRFYVDASWYVIEMESDIECGHCGTEFNGKKNATDRVILEFQVDKEGKMQEAKISKHLKLE